MTNIQDDPGHDFSKAIHSRRDGILRGWVTYYDAKHGTAEYKPIAWTIGKKGGKVTGYFADPGEYVVMNYRSHVSPKAELYSARNCDGGKVTVNSSGLGTQAVRQGGPDRPPQGGQAAGADHGPPRRDRAHPGDLRALTARGAPNTSRTRTLTTASGVFSLASRNPASSLFCRCPCPAGPIHSPH